MIGILIHEYDKYSLKKDVLEAFKDYNINTIGLFLTPQIKDLIDICDGIIIPGGDNIIKEELDIIKYIYEKDIPCLGICLGMQEMGYLFNGKINSLNSLKHIKPELKYAHKVKIDKNSKLYEILNKEEINVNSRHKEYLEKTNLKVSGYSDVIESIEDKNKRFFIGVQWHPESMIKYDLDRRKLIEYFVEQVKEYNKNKK